MRQVRRLDPATLLAHAGSDTYVRAEADPDRIRSAWSCGQALGWVVPSRRFGRTPHLVALGEPRDLAALVAAAREHDGVGSVTLPRDADRALGLALHPRNDWEWMWTATAPPAQAREAEVGWLGEADHDDLRTLLEHSPRHDAQPGRPGVLRWCGVRDGSGRLVAAAAHTEHRTGWPFLASVVTATEVRGQGLGAAVTAWLTRALLAEGHAYVTLGMYSDNDVARRVYLRLGFTIAQEFTSGRLS